MSTHSPYHARRRGRLFPRALGDVVQAATQPLMNKQGKLYGALLRDWASIVGPQRAATIRPQRLQWPNKDASGAILHLQASPATAPELHYAAAQIVEQCARYFGYRAIERIVVHATPDMHPVAAAKKSPPIGEKTPNNMGDILQRLRTRIATDDKA